MNEHFSTRRGALTGALALAAGTLSGTAVAATPHYKVVFQVSDADPGKWNLTLNNALNVQKDLGAANVTIEIIAFGPGTTMLRADAAVAARLGEALGAGIAASACENSMRGLHYQPSDMLPKVGFVSSGAAAIVKRQADGWAYLRS
jgi:intracellular sulfur oxidation DsrE/DsrF family protein